MNMNTEKIITEPLQIQKQYAMQAAKEADFGETWLTTANRALALQNIAYQTNPPQCHPQETYITAAQARELGAGAEYYMSMEKRWGSCQFLEVFPSAFEDGEIIKYRAIKQAQPEPTVEFTKAEAEEICRGNQPHRVEKFRRQAAAVGAVLSLDGNMWCVLKGENLQNGVSGFGETPYKALMLFQKNVELALKPVVAFCRPYDPNLYCQVSEDGEPAIRMLIEAAEQLRCNLGSSVDWFITVGSTLNLDIITNHQYELKAGKTYTYRTKATIKLDGNMVTPEQAAAEWDAKKKTHDVYSISKIETTLERHPRFSLTAASGYWYELRPKQPTWTGSREDVIALLKEKELL
jgi:hypothetical protein